MQQQQQQNVVNQGAAWQQEAATEGKVVNQVEPIQEAVKLHRPLVSVMSAAKAPQTYRSSSCSYPHICGLCNAKCISADHVRTHCNGHRHNAAAVREADWVRRLHSGVATSEVMGSSCSLQLVAVVILAMAWRAQCSNVLQLNEATMTELSVASADPFFPAALKDVDPHYVARKWNSTRRILSSANGNPVDDCWRSDPNWHTHRQSLADCAIGFGKNAVGGKAGNVYVVTDDGDDDVVNPKEGTLRYGVLQSEPLWIIFDRNMKIKLKNELILTSYKTIDGRGANVHLSGGAGLKIQFVQNIIVHGIHMHNIVPTGPATIRSTPDHVGHRQKTDGTAIAIFTSHDIWVDHCFFSKADDGLVDAIRGSTRITVSNCYFSHQDKAMLFGAHKQDTEDRDMTVTVAFNHFGPGLVQRLPRMRFGYCHVVNNNYPSGWGMYAIGGSEDPTFLSEGNRFVASGTKEVTKRVDDGGKDYGGEENWNWASNGDLLLNGAIFESSGANDGATVYKLATSLSARPASMVESITSDSGPLICAAGDGYCAGNYDIQSIGSGTKRLHPPLVFLSTMLLLLTLILHFSLFD